MNLNESYSSRCRYLADFEVRYRFYSSNEGGRRTGTPFQHYRCDWAYDGDDIVKNGIYMIWPEFLAEDGTIFPSEMPVPVVGNATMWILNPQLRAEIHCARIKVGIRGFFMEGNHRVAEAIVTRILGLQENLAEGKKQENQPAAALYTPEDGKTDENSAAMSDK